jgi:hypothetical protein
VNDLCWHLTRQITHSYIGFFNDLKVYAHAREILNQKRSSLSKQITKNTHRIIIKFRFAQHYLKISLTTFLYAILVERELLE